MDGQLATGPRLILWSWEHNDDLSFVDPQKTAIAYYAGTIILGRELATLHKRKNPLPRHGDVICFPVFRIENDHIDEPISDRAFISALQIIKTNMQKSAAHEVQIDFDARLQERQAYLQFLRQLRKELPANTIISITALASWCLSDKWLQKAPVDETVAMMFSLGKGKKEALADLSKNNLDSGAKCKQSVGLAVYELDTNAHLRSYHCLKKAARIYAFSALGWNKSKYKQLLSETEQCAK